MLYCTLLRMNNAYVHALYDAHISADNLIIADGDCSFIYFIYLFIYLFYHNWLWNLETTLNLL